MTNEQIIDVHCHLFNAQYTVMELVAATWNHLWGNYPHQKEAAKKRVERGFVETLQGAKDFAIWIARLLEIALSDCEGNYDIARECFAHSALSKSGLLVVAPLMMDIYFALDDNKDEEDIRRRGGRALAVTEPFGIMEDEKKDFDAHFNYIENLIRKEIRKSPTIKRRSSSGQALDAIFKDARQELLTTPPKASRSGDYEGIELSPGYKKHMHDLEDLRSKYPNLVFPFLAVDPRRIGIMKLIEMKVNKGKGRFKGIKIYPPVGYLPTHPNLEPIFDYCSQYDIPITLHCSEGGMQNFRSENYVTSWEGNNHVENFKASDGKKSRYYTAPEKWLPVLKKWPDLRINFAHFGGGDKLDSGDIGWMNAIIKLLQEHPHVYTDISYYSKPGLPQKISHIINQYPILNTRLMFGTDYIMIMMDKGLGGLTKYFDRFTALNHILLSDNARNFLKI